MRCVLVRLLGLLAASLAVLLPVLPSSGQSKIGATALFQTIDANARSRALGEATVALRGYAGAAQVNPATLGRAGFIQAGTDLSRAFAFRTPWPYTEGWIASPSVDVKVDRWALGYQYKDFGSDYEISYYSGDGVDYATSPIDIHDYAHKLAAAFDLRPNFTVGLGVNWIRSEELNFFAGGLDESGALSKQTTNSFSLDLGVFYERGVSVPYARLRPSLGWSLTDFGPTVRYGDQDLRYPLPMTMRGGAALQAETAAQVWGRPLFSLGFYGQLSKVLLQTDFLTGDFETDGPFRALFSTWGPYDVSINGDGSETVTVSTLDQISTQRGMEVSLINILYLRSGFFYESRYNGGRKYASGGWGIDLYYLALDRTWANRREDDFGDLSFWKLTARVPLGGEAEGNFWPDLLRYLKGSR